MPRRLASPMSQDNALVPVLSEESLFNGLLFLCVRQVVSCLAWIRAKHNTNTLNIRHYLMSVAYAAGISRIHEWVLQEKIAVKDQKSYVVW